MDWRVDDAAVAALVRGLVGGIVLVDGVAGRRFPVTGSVDVVLTVSSALSVRSPDCPLGDVEDADGGVWEDILACADQDWLVRVRVVKRD